MAPTLNANIYPVMSRIFELADTDSLLALRTVSKSFKHRANSLLAYHTVLNCPPEDYPDILVFFREWNLPKRAHTVSDYWSYRPILDHARIVDFDDSIYFPNENDDDPPDDYHAHGEVIYPLVHALANVHTLRFLEISLTTQPVSWAIRSKRVVFFLRLWRSWYESLNEPPSFTGFPLGPIGEGVEKVVVNVVDCRKSSEYEEAVLRAPIWPHSLRHVVFIFESRNSSLKNRDWEVPPPMGIFANILMAMAFNIPLVKYTFVGMLDVDPELFAMDYAASHENIKHALMSHVVALKAQESPNRDEIVAAVDSCLHFCTREEYAASLTGNDFEVETSEGWISPFPVV